MQEIKYQPLKSNDDGDSVIQESNLDQNEGAYYLKESIYVINNFETIINWLQSHNETNRNYNQTDIYENIPINLYGEDSATTAIYDKLHKKIIQDSATTTDDIFITTATDATYITNAKAATTNYNTITTKKLYEDGGTMENKIKTNDYGNVDLTTTATTSNEIAIDLKDDTTNTTTINLNSNNNNTTTIEKPITTAIYLNNTIITSLLLQTTDITTDLTTFTAITTTTTRTPMTPPPLKTPDVKSPHPAEDKKYFINTSRCHIPFVDPFTSEIRKIFKPQHSTGCTKDQPIITVTFNELDAQYLLHINYTVAEILRKPTNNTNAIEEDVLCCYQEIIRSGSGANVDASFK
ncbi:uncharacterized protein LOC135952251 [Calliphora vicina]|uniref:uncharacterized protein LOC135952251 n=1 Tax=Calliphora vicina TaxID=7373 RepID=UPI00325B3772